MEIGEKIGHATTVAIKETAGVLPFNPITTPAKVQPIIDNLTTPTKIYALSLDLADFVFITGNIITKVQIVRVYAEEELSGWVYWYDVCGRQIKYWRSEIKAEFDRWPSTFIAENLLNRMGHVINCSMTAITVAMVTRPHKTELRRAG